VICLPNAKKRIIIAFDFWHIVTQEGKVILTEYDQILLDYMYRRISKTTALIKIHNLHENITDDNLRKFTKEEGWSLILKKAGGLSFICDFKNVVKNLRKSYPGIVIGIATTNIPQFYDMLYKTEIKDILDFVVNCPIINCEQPGLEFCDHLRKFVGEGRILPVRTYECEPTLMVGSEVIRYDNRINPEPLLDIINRYLSP
jgi:hypothetical protein